MAKKSKRRVKALAEKRARRRARNQPGKDGDNSNYGRKKAYCDKHGVWGWEVPEPKPWRGGLR